MTDEQTAFSEGYPMDAIPFVQELETFKAERLSAIVGAGRTSLADGAPGDAKRMLQIALANEISVSELAAAWMPSTPEIDVKIALARQAGDEAGHFQLVADRLSALGFDIAGFKAPGPPIPPATATPRSSPACCRVFQREPWRADLTLDNQALKGLLSRK